jgi:hypothetical protein
VRRDELAVMGYKAAGVEVKHGWGRDCDGGDFAREVYVDGEVKPVGERFVNMGLD